jgi:hypothetical protein
MAFLISKKHRDHKRKVCRTEAIRFRVKNKRLKMREKDAWNRRKGG